MGKSPSEFGAEKGEPFDSKAHPPLPPHEEARLDAVRRLNLLDTPAEDRFDRITRIAARTFNVPFAMVTLVDRDRVWFKSAYGTPLVEVPRMRACCDVAVRQSEIFVVADLRKDPRFADNVLVKGQPFIKFYAGYPLASPDGHKVGTLCIMDTVARDFKPEESDALRDLGLMVEDELNITKLSWAHRELLETLEGVRRRAAIDPVTRLWNREAISDLLKRSLAHAAQLKKNVGVIFADVDGFKKLNDTHGHPVGDAVLRETAFRLQSSLRSSDAVGRYGGDEFLAILHETAEPAVVAVTKKIHARFNEGPLVIDSKEIPVTVSVGAVMSQKDKRREFEELVKAADAAMYRAKQAGRNRVEFDLPKKS